MTGPHSRAEAIVLLRSMTEAEGKQWAKRTAEIAEELNDLGSGMRAALQEIAAARKAGDA
jgi:cell division protein FtsB